MASDECLGARFVFALPPVGRATKDVTEPLHRRYGLTDYLPRLASV